MDTLPEDGSAPGPDGQGESSPEQNSQPNGKHICKANASELARLRWQKEREKAAEAGAISGAGGAEGDAEQHGAASNGEAAEMQQRAFSVRFVVRVRKEIGRCFARLDAEYAKESPDGGTINQLSNALARMWELEGQVCQRPQRPTVRAPDAKSAGGGLRRARARLRPIRP